MTSPPPFILPRPLVLGEAGTANRSPSIVIPNPPKLLRLFVVIRGEEGRGTLVDGGGGVRERGIDSNGADGSAFSPSVSRSRGSLLPGWECGWEGGLNGTNRGNGGELLGVGDERWAIRKCGADGVEDPRGELSSLACSCGEPDPLVHSLGELGPLAGNLERDIGDGEPGLDSTLGEPDLDPLATGFDAGDTILLGVKLRP